MDLIHYGSSKYDPNKIKPIKNYNWVKPRGGLWTSPINSEWCWKDWCDQSGFSDCIESNSFKLKLKPETKILKIDSLADLITLPKIKSDDGHYLDFELLSSKFDVIWLTEKGQGETHLSGKINLYGWDCESVLIMNSNCCIEIK